MLALPLPDLPAPVTRAAPAAGTALPCLAHEELAGGRSERPRADVAAAPPAFDPGIGLDPDKGGFFAKPALETWFPHATVLLV